MRISAIWIAASLAVVVWLDAAESITAKEPARPAADSRAAADREVVAALGYLGRQQEADGAWRSSHYPALADGPSLTTLVLRSTRRWRADPAFQANFRRGVEYLTGVSADGELTYGTYTAANAVLALGDDADTQQLRLRWIDYLRTRQLNAALGWQPDDPEFGGWGYARQLPTKPAAGQPQPPLEAPNLSATVFALEALVAAGSKADDPAIGQALAFVKRCQNFDEASPQRDELNDGGFYFVLDDPVRNKAGRADSEGAGPIRFRSYSTATSDGLRALRLCGLADDHPRVVAARDWLMRGLNRHQLLEGYRHDRQLQRESSWFYACWSASRDLPYLPAERRRYLAHMLSGDLIGGQRIDGSWRNRNVELREDDPVVATALAVGALANCGEQLGNDK